MGDNWKMNIDLRMDEYGFNSSIIHNSGNKQRFFYKNQPDHGEKTLLECPARNISQKNEKWVPVMGKGDFI